jgi:hypothetical protein
MKKLLLASSDTEKLNLFEQEIRRLHAYRTFQTAENISQALSLIGIKAVWDKVGAILGMNSSDARIQLDLVVDRRNRIVHESDVDPSLGIGNKYPIDFALVDKAVGFLNSVVHTIHQIAEAEVIFLKEAEGPGEG